MSKSAYALAMITLGALSACGLVPSDPAGAPVGLRIDGPVITVITPRCEGQGIVSAKVEKVSSDGTWRPVWEASGFTGDANEGIKLDSGDWSATDGRYALDSDLLDISVDTQDDSYGAGRINSEYLQGLPEGQFWVDSDVMSIAD